MGAYRQDLPGVLVPLADAKNRVPITLSRRLLWLAVNSVGIRKLSETSLEKFVGFRAFQYFATSVELIASLARSLRMAKCTFAGHSKLLGAAGGAYGL